MGEVSASVRGAELGEGENSACLAACRPPDSLEGARSTAARQPSVRLASSKLTGWTSE